MPPFLFATATVGVQRLPKRDLQCQTIWIYIWIHPADVGGSSMGDTAQKRALRNYRSRLVKRGVARFEVLGLDADRELIRSLAKRLSEDGPDAVRIRTAVSRTLAGEPPKKGGILAALRRSPLVGADLDLARSQETGRQVDL